MVYLSASEEWQHQSALLLQARPTTTRITTKYKIPNLESAGYLKAKKRKRDAEGDEKDTGASKVPRAWLVLKTYDPASGVVLKFKTDRAAEVGRLIGGLGRLGRHMAALPERAGDSADTVMEDALPAVEAPVADTPATKGTISSTAETKPQQTAGPSGGAGGKKKKKGKK